MKTIRILIFLITISMFSGCAALINSSPMHKLEIGMTRSDVKKVLKHYEYNVAAAYKEGNASKEVWRYEQNGYEYLLVFTDGTLSEWDSRQIYSPHPHHP